MKWLILIGIRIYWLLPKKYRRHCLFKESCSHYVYNITFSGGFLNGIKALKQRIKQCRPGYQILFDNQEIFILLNDGNRISSKDASVRLLTEANKMSDLIKK